MSFIRLVQTWNVWAFFILTYIRSFVTKWRVYECYVEVVEIPRIICRKLSYTRMCPAHNRLKGLEHDAYHMEARSRLEYVNNKKFMDEFGIKNADGTFDMERTANSIRSITHLVELRQREEFRRKYREILDEAHGFWEDILQLDIWNWQEWELYKNRIIRWGTRQEEEERLRAENEDLWEEARFNERELARLENEDWARNHLPQEQEEEGNWDSD